MSEKIREIRESALGLDDGIEIDFRKLRPPGDLRLWAFGASIAAAVLGGIGLWTAPVSYQEISYSETWVNDRIAERLPIGEKTVVKTAAADMSGDVFALAATATDGKRYMDVVMSGALKVDAVSWTIKISNPETAASTVYRDGKSTGQEAAEFVPEMDDYIPDDNTAWKVAKSAVGLIEDAARWTASAVSSAATGELMAETQFPSQAKRAVWEMTIIKIPDADRDVMARAAVAGVSMRGGQIIVNVEHWDLNFLTMVSIALLAGGATLLGCLLYAPHFLAD
jgi:hypothetical protein